jgi:small subunit ribosomal protein S20
MPNSKQAKKRLRQDELARQRNKADRTAMKTAVKLVLTAEDGDAARQALPAAMKRIDKCAKKNIIHDNAAARKKSQLSRHISGL